MDNRNIILTFFILLLGTSSVYALGVSSPYWNSNPLKMYPGETRDIEFTLVNSVNEEDTTATIVLVESAGIAEIVGRTEFDLPSGSNDKKATLRIIIPDEAELGQEYSVKFLVRNAEQSEEGNVQVNLGYNVEFPVLVVDRTEVQSQTENTNTKFIAATIIVAILLVLAMVYFVLRKHSEKQI